MVWDFESVAKHVATNIPPGSVVNLGVGLPLAVGDHLGGGKGIILHSENGILGLGPKPPPGEEDPDVVNAGKQKVSLVPGAAITDQVDSFALVRAGYLDLTILGAYQVSVNGDVANWKRPGEKIAGVGGAVDIANGARDVWVMMKAATDDGTPKLLRECTFPLTASAVVSRIYTELAVFEPSREDQRFRVLEMAPGISKEEVQAVVDADLAWD